MSSSNDMNELIGALLRDLAAAQRSKPSEWGYKRAALAVLALDRSIESYLRPDGTLEKIPNVGPKSERVILEVLRSGGSPTVERAVEDSSNADDIDRRRGLRRNFLSRSRVVAALEDSSLRGPTIADYKGDLQMHSTWSDGSQTLEDIVEAGLSRGYSYCA